MIFFHSSYAKNEIKNNDDYKMTNRLEMGGGCVGETNIYTTKSYGNYINKIEKNIKYRNLKKGIKYGYLSPTYEGVFIRTSGCGYDQIVAGINGVPKLFISSENTSWGVSRNYTPEDKYYPALISITKLKTLKKINFNINSDKEPSDVIHEFLKVTIKYKNIYKNIYGVAIIKGEWMDDVPDWLEKEQRNAYEKQESEMKKQDSERTKNE
jgi:hypothetical protein